MYAKNENRPFPYDVISFTGSDIKLMDELDHELYHIISLLLAEKGLEVDRILYNKLMPSREPNLDLSMLVEDVYDKFDGLDEQVILRK